MRIQGYYVRTVRIVAIVCLVGLFALPGKDAKLKIDRVMTPDEMQRSGISGLSAEQRAFLDQWLTAYTIRVYSAAQDVREKAPERPSARPVPSGCSPAIESSISGEIEGWDGDTIFKLDNGQIWQQAEYDYTYFYAYHPDVTIYGTSSGCRMKVEDESETVIVKRIK